MRCGFVIVASHVFSDMDGSVRESDDFSPHNCTIDIPACPKYMYCTTADSIDMTCTWCPLHDHYPLTNWNMTSQEKGYVGKALRACFAFIVPIASVS